MAILQFCSWCARWYTHRCSVSVCLLPVGSYYCMQHTKPVSGVLARTFHRDLSGFTDRLMTIEPHPPNCQGRICIKPVCMITLIMTSCRHLSNNACLHCKVHGSALLMRSTCKLNLLYLYVPCNTKFCAHSNLSTNLADGLFSGMAHLVQRMNACMYCVNAMYLH